MLPSRENRIVSIDIMRALTMVLMIFVNDLGYLKEIPAWLDHVKPGIDGVGLADLIFPAFLFIVGLSLPIAIYNRQIGGDSEFHILKHILLRTMALLIMGVFLVNVETYNAQLTHMPRYFWNPLCCLCFILIWNNYPKHYPLLVPYIFRTIGIIILLVLAYLYRGNHGSEVIRFAPQWWGILGLIGWSYLAAALITLYANNKFWLIFMGWAFFCFLSIAIKAHLIYRIGFFSYIPEPIMKGTLPAIVMSGVLTTFIFQHFRQKKNVILFTVTILCYVVILLGAFYITRKYWGLSKLGATPAWLFLSSALTLMIFSFIYLLTDVAGRQNWFKMISPAGTDTLLCYLMPFFIGFILKRVLDLKLPEFLMAGALGLLKSFLLALLCVWVTHILIKFKIRLKL